MSTQTDTINASEAERVVFDHVGGQLLSSAEAAGFTKVPVENDDDAGAAEWLIKHSSWNLAYVHVHEPEWQELVAKVSQGRILVRFSSDGFHPMPLESANPLCLRCLRKTEELRDTEEANDVGRLSEALLKQDAFKQLGKGTVVPPELAGLISFRIPHRLRALEATLGAFLAAKAASAGDADLLRGVCDALQINGDLPQPPEGFTRMQSIWRHLNIVVEPDEKFKESLAALERDLSEELGVDDFKGHPSLGLALKDLSEKLSSSQGDDELDSKVALEAFKKTRDYLRK
ncbi:MAG: hypothetical protein H7A51_19965 [Akkermansiaceae bacterium]|nr:hypothetical protein [Akkermansiaceae bacterium]